MGMIRGFYPTSIEIAENGRNGRAVIRVHGIDAGINFIDSAIPTQDLPFRLMNEYILEPDKDYVTIRSTIFNDADGRYKVLIADMPFWRGDTDTFVPRSGYNISDVDPVSFGRWVGSTNRLDLDVSYALATTSPGRKFYSPYFYKDVSPLLNGLIKVGAHGAGSYERIFIVGDGDTRMFPEVINAYDESDDYGIIEGNVSVAGKSGPDSVQVMVQDTQRPDGSNYVAALYPDDSGEYSVQVAPGEYQLTVVGAGRENSEPTVVDIDAGDVATQDLDPNPPGMLAIDVTDDIGDPIPCKISLFAGYDANVNQQPIFRLFSLTGDETFPVPPGDYTAVASRGYEYEIHQENLTVIEGDTTEFAASLDHSVDTTGQMSGDFHIHTIFSSDSHEPVIDRVKHLAGEGLEIPVVTDHDVQVDWTPFVEELGAGPWVKIINGTEISPTSGHFNSWPVVRPDGVSEYYSVAYMLYDETMTAVRRYEHPEMWDVMLADYAAEIFQINHPRSGGGGWLTYLQYDPTSGVGALDQSKWREDFHAIEVFNGGGGAEVELKDWFSFLDQGLNYTMTGNSDSHTMDSELGNPRNLVVMPTDDPLEADQDDMIDAVLAHRSQVTSGPVITFGIDGFGIGDLVANHGAGDVEAQITVQAPSWMSVNYVEVLSNHGTVIFSDTVDPSANVVRYDETVNLSVGDDAYFVVRAGHTTAKLGPVNPGQNTYAITNPIWVDIDDNGVFNPPGLPEIH